MTQDTQSRDRQALELIVRSIVLNTRDHARDDFRQLRFTVGVIRRMAQEIAKLCEIETHESKSTLPKSPQPAD